MAEAVTFLRPCEVQRISREFPCRDTGSVLVRRGTEEALLVCPACAEMLWPQWKVVIQAEVRND